VKTVDRLVRILDAFSSEQASWSLADLSAHLDLPKSTLHRFLMSLEAHGILRRDTDDKRWCLGYRLFVWGSLAAESTGLRHLARPFMRHLVAATGETVILTTYYEQEVICIEKVETNRSVRMTMDVGTRRPLHAGASSKALMAYLPPDEVQSIIDQGLSKACINTITDPNVLEDELAKIRRQGYAESQQETDLGAWGVATPVFDGRGDVIAAIGIAGPSSRMSNELVESYVALCKDASQKITRLLRSGA
jgi:DNA-binding IclR family transcriptional regulator